MTQKTAVLLMAYGTPRTPAEIEPYYTDIRRGRAPTPEQLGDLVARYDAIGGISPLAARTEAQRDALQKALNAIAPDTYGGKTPNQPPVYQMRMVGPIENAGVSLIPKRAVEPTPILMRQPDLACERNSAFMDSHQPVRSPAWKSFI